MTMPHSPSRWRGTPWRGREVGQESRNRPPASARQLQKKLRNELPGVERSYIRSTMANTASVFSRDARVTAGP